MPITMDMEKLSARIVAARRGRDLESVSREIGVYASSLGHVEEGLPPQLDTLARLCSWLGTTMDEFVT